MNIHRMSTSTLESGRGEGGLPRIRVAVSTFHRGKLPKDSNKWGAFNRSFKKRTLSANQLAEVIQDGYAFAPLCARSRIAKDYLAAQHICVDFDTCDRRSDLSFLQRDEFIARYAAILHTTASHTPARPRGRVIFCLDRPIEDPSRYGKMVGAVASQFDGADMACTDPARLWFGAPGCDMVCHPQKVLPVAVVDTLMPDDPDSADLSHTGMPDFLVLEDVEGMVSRAIAYAQVGTRNSTGFRLFCALRQRGLSRESAEPYARRYQQAVAPGGHPYTWREAAASLASAYARKPRSQPRDLAVVLGLLERVAWGGRHA